MKDTIANLDDMIVQAAGGDAPPPILKDDSLYAVRHKPSGLFLTEDHWYDMRELLLSTAPLLYTSIEQAQGEFKYPIRLTEWPEGMDLSDVSADDFEVVGVTLIVRPIV